MRAMRLFTTQSPRSRRREHQCSLVIQIVLSFISLFIPHASAIAADAPARAQSMAAEQKQIIAREPVIADVGDNGQLADPPSMLGFAEFMRLKPAKRALYLTAIREMLVEISLLRVEDGPRLVTDGENDVRVHLYGVETLLQSLLPRASAEPPAGNPATQSLAIWGPSEAQQPETLASQCVSDSNPKGTAVVIGNSLICAQAPSTNSICQTQFTLYQGHCVKVADLKNAYADAATLGLPKTTDATCKEISSAAGAKTKRALPTTGEPCVYAGFISTRTDKGCPRPPASLTIGHITVTCEDHGQLLCNPLIFGVAKFNDTSRPEQAPTKSTAYGVCIQPSLTATRDCNALSTKAAGKDAQPLGQPLPAKGNAYTRADQKATDGIWSGDSVQSEYNKLAEGLGNLCSAKNKAHFCQECATMAARLKSANAVGTPDTTGATPAVK